MEQESNRCLLRTSGSARDDCPICRNEG